MDFMTRSKHAIPVDIRMISGCEDKQTAADVSNVEAFELPDPNGRESGACTAAFLNVVYADHHKPNKDLSFQDVLTRMRSVLTTLNFEQIPQLSSSRPMDVGTKFDLTPDDFSGRKRAVLIGINYVGQSGELLGCHNDVLNMVDYIKNAHGFKDEDITILMDDGVHADPTRANILGAYSKIADESESGDVVFLHYSGHGGKLRDDGNDEADGCDETLFPLDFQSAGQICDDDLLKDLVMKFRSGVFVTSMMDCCHSGTILDLPYNYKADGSSSGMEANEDYDFSKMKKNERSHRRFSRCSAVLDLPYDYKADGSSSGMVANEDYDFRKMKKMKDLIGVSVGASGAGMVAVEVTQCCKIS